MNNEILQNLTVTRIINTNFESTIKHIHTLVLLISTNKKCQQIMAHRLNIIIQKAVSIGFNHIISSTT